MNTDQILRQSQFTSIQKNESATKAVNSRLFAW